jgi:hypothetical protein
MKTMFCLSTRVAHSPTLSVANHVLPLTQLLLVEDDMLGRSGWNYLGLEGRTTTLLSLARFGFFFFRIAEVGLLKVVRCAYEVLQYCFNHVSHRQRVSSINALLHIMKTFSWYYSLFHSYCTPAASPFHFHPANYLMPLLPRGQSISGLAIQMVKARP